MRGMVLVFVIFVPISLLGVLAINAYSSPKNQLEKPKILEFKTFTSAVCEEKNEFVYCKDEVFINCNGNVLKAADVAECDGIKLDVPKATGFAFFEKDWKDPRE